MKHSILLFLTACIWGVAFVAQSAGMDYIGPVTFNAVRFLLGGTVLLPLIGYQKRHSPGGQAHETKQSRMNLIGGICCGIAICFASLFQQFGIQYTTVGKTGFITTLYVIIVPILGIFLKRRARAFVWAGAGIAAVGLYLLCWKESMPLNKGDVLVFICAVLFSIHIMVIDYFSPKADGVKMSCIQFFVSGIICAVGAFIFEEPSLSAILSGWLPIIYAGVLSCGVAYTLQIIGQKGVEPTAASLILSLESVISVLAGWLILGQRLNGREMAGCAVVFAAVIFVQVSEARIKK